LDGVSWDILHEARKDRHILEPSQDQIENLPTGDDVDFVSIAKKHHRHTWKVNALSYYQHFRFATPTYEELKALYESVFYSNASGPGPDGRMYFSFCLHGVGFELYGDVKSAT